MDGRREGGRERGRGTLKVYFCLVGVDKGN